MESRCLFQQRGQNWNKKSNEHSKSSQKSARVRVCLFNTLCIYWQRWSTAEIHAWRNRRAAWVWSTDEAAGGFTLLLATDKLKSEVGRTSKLLASSLRYPCNLRQKKEAKRDVNQTIYAALKMLFLLFAILQFVSSCQAICSGSHGFAPVQRCAEEGNSILANLLVESNLLGKLNKKAHILLKHIFLQSQSPYAKNPLMAPAYHGKPRGVPSSWGSRESRDIGGRDQCGAVTRPWSPKKTSTSAFSPPFWKRICWDRNTNVKSNPKPQKTPDIVTYPMIFSQKCLLFRRLLFHFFSYILKWPSSWILSFSALRYKLHHISFL